MNELETAVDYLREIEASIRQFQRRRLIAWSIRWTLAVLLIVLAFRTYPIAAWILVAFVPLGAWNLYRIISAPRRADLELRSLISSMESIGRSLDKSTGEELTP